MAHDNLTTLPFRVVRIVVDARQRIAKNREGFLEGHTMLPEV
jgi:hypothetical protein